MELILIRHGITQGNLERRYLGQRNDQSLAREGIRQLEDYAARKRYPRGRSIFQPHEALRDSPPAVSHDGAGGAALP